MGGRKQGTEQKSQKTDFLGQAVATRNAYGIALLELGKRDGRIVVLDADLSSSTRTIEFANAFPDRFFNMGVSEQDMVGTAGGLSLTGKIPFASTFAVFETGRAWDQIRQTICYSNLNVKLVATHGGITVGEDGASHQALEDIALMRVLPNMTVIIPSDGFETKQVIDAVAEYDGPVYVRLGRGKVPAVMPEGYKFQIGKAYKFHAIHDTTIIANGIMVSLALKASEMLAKEGINAGVVNMSTVKPLDTDTLLEVAKNSKLIVTAEEHSIIGGLGSAVSEFLSENRAVLIKKVGVKDTFGCSGKPEELLKLYGLTADNIVKVVMESRA
ncbi:transketolase family protein [Thermodesulfovibrionales bacterium]|nr:transketolase family protein [Thermodesulfovibrionales bacterium]